VSISAYYNSLFLIIVIYCFLLLFISFYSLLSLFIPYYCYLLFLITIYVKSLLWSKTIRTNIRHIKT
jgi:hypothetical protein